MKFIRIALLGAIASMWSVAAMSAVTFDVDGAGSGATVALDGGFCVGCSFTVDAVANLDDVAFSLSNVGDSATFDFLNVNWGGLFGGLSGTVSSTLAFELPGGVAAGTGTGIVGFIGPLAGGALTWASIADIVLPGNTSYGVELQDLGPGLALGSATVAATVTLLAVPEPASIALLGLGALGLVRLRRKSA